MSLLCITYLSADVYGEHQLAGTLARCPTYSELSEMWWELPLTWTRHPDP